MGTLEFHWSACLGQQEYTTQDSHARHAGLAGRARLGGIQSVHVAPFSLVSRFSRNGLWPPAVFFSILLNSTTTGLYP